MKRLPVFTRATRWFMALAGVMLGHGHHKNSIAARRLVMKNKTNPRGMVSCAPLVLLMAAPMAPPSQPYSQSGAGPRTAAVSVFDLDPENSEPGGIAYANGLLYVGDSDRGTVSTYRLNGQRVGEATFGAPNYAVTGVTYANGLFYVADLFGTVYVHRPGGRRVAEAEFHVDVSPNGITHGNGLFYVVADEVNVYRENGQRLAEAGFGSFLWPSITYANGLLYVADWSGKVYAYRPDGQPAADSDFDLDSRNSTPTGITFGNGLFYVVDGFDNKVYVYRPSG